MSDSTPAASTAEATATQEQGSGQPNQPPADQDVNWQEEAEKWKALSRKHEEASQKNADKAKQFEAWQDSQKTEQQKAEDAAKALQSERDTALTEAARLRAAIAHGLTEDDLDLIGGSTPEEIEQRAEKLAARLQAQQTQTPPPDPRLGRENTPTGTGDWLRDQFNSN